MLGQLCVRRSTFYTYRSHTSNLRSFNRVFSINHEAFTAPSGRRHFNCLQPLQYRFSLPRPQTTTQSNRIPTELATRSANPSYRGKNLHRVRTNQIYPNTEQGLPPYEEPTTGLLSFLPRRLIPYAELVRLDKPAGTLYLFFPCLFSTLLAAPLTHPMLDSGQILTTTGLFLAGALIMRGAGCTINDLWDRNLDPHVARTRLRPIARGAITPQSALIFTGAQLLVGLGILAQFPQQCLWYGIPSLILVATYPLAKRVTNYPQVVLGLAFSWGAIMGFPALGLDLLAQTSATQAAACLYASCVSWTVLYDMIYAHMDIKDDVKAGIKSIALRHEKNTKAVLSGLAVVQVALLSGAGIAISATPVFFIGSCGTAAITLGVMIWKVNLKSVSSCWWWFRNGCWLTGGAISGGLIAEYATHFVAS